MPIAKEQLRLGFVVVANPGTYIDEDSVAKYGWQDKVDADKAPAGDNVTTVAPEPLADRQSVGETA